VMRTTFAFLALVAGMLLLDRTASAAPVEYVRICDVDGPGYFYIPGMDTCINANEIAATQSAVAANTATAYQGVAISSALVAPFMPSNANFAVSGNWANFSGKDGFGLSGLARISNSNFFLSAGFGASPSGGPTVQRAGFMFAW
jgi:Porin subfamily